MKDTRAARSTEILRIRAPAELARALDKTAAALMRTRSNYVRLAIVDRLKADGVSLNVAA
jgi:predicted transcriptional regulator